MRVIIKALADGFKVAEKVSNYWPHDTGCGMLERHREVHV